MQQPHARRRRPPRKRRRKVRLRNFGIDAPCNSRSRRRGVEKLEGELKTAGKTAEYCEALANHSEGFYEEISKLVKGFRLSCCFPGWGVVQLVRTLPRHWLE